MAKLKFEKLDVDGLAARMSRAKVPGGWLLILASNSGGGATFYPDPQHKWDGGSVADDRRNAESGRAAGASTAKALPVSISKASK